MFASSQSKVRTAYAATLVLAMTLMTGCVSPVVSTRAKPPKPVDHRGVVIMLPGIEGNAWQFAGTVRGLKQAGLDYEIEIIPWGPSLFGSLQNLIDLAANKRRAQHIADRIVALKREDPQRPVVLVGASGGGGLAILTLEILPDDVMPDRVILMCAAISNEYDVDGVLPQCKDKLVNYYSPDDGIVGWGTSLFGTIDRKKCVSAGHCGFVKDGRLQKSDKLLQVCWTPDWRRWGHHGGHIDWLSQAWAREVLAQQIDPRLSTRLAKG